MSGELPEGWVARPLPDVLTINPPKPPADALPAATPVSFVPMPAVDADRGVIDGATEKPFAEVRKGYTAFADGDVLLAKITPCFENGKAAVAHGLKNGLGFGSSEFFVLRSHGAVLPEYVFHYVRQQSFRDDGAEQMSGAVGQARVPADFLRSVELPVPPLAEQKRIVEKVEALLADVSHARDRLAKVPLILKRFRLSVLAAACRGKLTEDWRAEHEAGDARADLASLAAKNIGRKTRRGVPEKVELPDPLAAFEPPGSWAVVSVADCLRAGALLDVKDGNHGANHPAVADFGDRGLPFITAAQVGRFTIDYDGAYKIAGEPLARLRVGFAEPGDAILTHKGSVGRTAVCERRCVLTPQTTYYRVQRAVLDAKYLAYWFASPWFYSQLAAVMSQTTRDFVPITEQYRLFLAVPPLAEQREIARRVSVILSLGETVERRALNATAMATKTPQSVLTKAFSGELVPTEAELARVEERDYEPASALLARLAAVAPSSTTKARLKPRTKGKRASR